jgi:hypothetical protein
LAQKSFDSRVVSLTASWQEPFFLLRGDIQGLEKDAENVKGCRVYFAEYPSDNPPCDGCPIEYQDYGSFGPEVVRENKLFCRISGMGRNHIYFFKVHLVGPKGVLGPSSDSVKVVVN